MSPSESESAPRFAVVGNPENRRVALFTAAVRAAGLPAPRVVPWTGVLRAGGADFAPGETVRLDSPGENAEADLLLRGVDDPTRVEGSARWYTRFLTAVGGLRGGVRLDDPGDLAVLFDKRRCHAVLEAAGVPVPSSPTSGPAAAAVGGWDDVRRLMREHRMPRLFVKLAHGSSASGVLAVESGGRGRVRATTSVERAEDGRLYNSLRIRRYEDERDIAAVVDTLAPDGLHLERWVPKASQQGRAADLRVLVVAGRATHAVVRTSTAPLTNLHLGGARGDLDAARRAVEAAGGRWSDVLAVCERAAACFPRTLCVGVDLLPAVGWRRFAVGEVNAFGDLLPRLTGLPGSGAEGLDTYAAQVAAVLGAPARPHHRTEAPARSSRPSPPSPPSPPSLPSLPSLPSPPSLSFRPAPQHRTGPGHAVA
ncbi:STM4014 family protein [Streptomyces sp. NPDC004042]|uniref:STM4014 family protein n=1 Tax=Streptomyces sp. NPDC004042 TaxID=3154451 RepID=UPI0033BDDFDD